MGISIHRQDMLMRSSTVSSSCVQCACALFFTFFPCLITWLTLYVDEPVVVQIGFPALGVFSPKQLTADLLFLYGLGKNWWKFNSIVLSSLNSGETKQGFKTWDGLSADLILLYCSRNIYIFYYRLMVAAGIIVTCILCFKWNCSACFADAGSQLASLREEFSFTKGVCRVCLSYYSKNDKLCYFAVFSRDDYLKPWKYQLQRVFSWRV